MTAVLQATISKCQGIDVFKIDKPRTFILVEPSTGMVAVASREYRELNGCHYWCHRGDGESIYQFVLGTQQDYVIGKLFGDLEELDVEETKIRLSDDVREMLNDKDITPSAAEDLLHEIDDCYEIEAFNSLDISEVWERISYRPKHCCKVFWEQIWVPFQNLIKTEGMA